MRNRNPCRPVHHSGNYNTEDKRKMLTRVGVPVESEAEPSAPDPQPATLICFSHLRWNFVFQRPQHLMSRFARDMAVIYWEEPVEIGPRDTAYLQVREAEDAPNVRIVVPHLPQGMPDDAREAALKRLLDAHTASIRGTLISLVLYADDAALLARARCRPDGVRRDGRAQQVQVRAGAPARARAGADRQGGHRLHRRLEPVRGEEGPPLQRPLLPVVGRPRPISSRRGRASSSPPTRKTCRGRASASTA